MQRVDNARGGVEQAAAQAYGARLNENKEQQER